MPSVTVDFVRRAADFADSMYAEAGFDPAYSAKGEDIIPHCGIPVLLAPPGTMGESGCWLSKVPVTDEAPHGYVISHIAQITKGYLSLLVYQRFFHWLHRNPEPICHFNSCKVCLLRTTFMMCPTKAYRRITAMYGTDACTLAEHLEVPEGVAALRIVYDPETYDPHRTIPPVNVPSPKWGPMRGAALPASAEPASESLSTATPGHGPVL